MKRLVIGILAHVDSGKTTLSEGLLYQAGNLKKPGRVDHGDAFLDSFALERERGITIFAKQAILRRGELELTLLDTPGHVDFSPETERTLGILDGAVLVISGTDGVQSHTETLWRLLARHRIPTFLFINKMDLPGTNRGELMAELKQRLSDGCVDFGGAWTDSAFLEQVALCDEGLLNGFLEKGGLEPEAVAEAVGRRKVFPCYFGAALKLLGLEGLLDGLERFMSAPAYPEAFGARVFKIARDEQGNRLTYLKVTGGSLRVKEQLWGSAAAEGGAEKVNQIRLYSGAKYQCVEEALPGMVCGVTGPTQTKPGQGFGFEKESAAGLLEPVLTYGAELPPGRDVHEVLAALRILEEEEPMLRVVWNEALQELHVQLMGEVQLEVLKRLMLERFGMELSFGRGRIAYKETIAGKVEGVGHFEPLRHYAEVHVLLEPGERGSGLSFGSVCSEDVLAKSWQRLILTHLEEKCHRGVLTGAPITDMKLTLAAGRAHPKHTEGGDFRQATYRAVRQGLMQAESILLEPWYDFRLELPREAVGRALSDLRRMEGSAAPPQIRGETVLLTGSVSAAALGDYNRELMGYTHGRGRLSCTLRGYEPCHNTQAVVEAAGYDPESDLDNTPDSVFCAHGAGFAVKWDKVEELMQVERVLRREPGEGAQETAGETALPRRRGASYCAALEQDKELLEIFQRTYGPIKRDLHKAFSPPPKERAEKPSEPLWPRNGQPDYLLVDGYNILFAWDDLAALARENLDAARSRLIHMLCNYQGFCGCELILVFDAYKVKGNRGEVEKFRNISVVYTKEAETADRYIEKVTHALGRERRVRVATSDGLEQLIILSHGALRLPASAFRKEVDEVERSIRSFLEQGQRPR